MTGDGCLMMISFEARSPLNILTGQGTGQGTGQRFSVPVGGFPLSQS